MLNAFETIRGNGCSFLVAGRINQTNRQSKRYLSFEHIKDTIHGEIVDLFDALPAFRCDISSSEIRNKVVRQIL